MINIWDIYNENLDRINKEQSGRSFSVEQFNRVARFVNILYLKQRIGLPEDYQLGAALSPIRWQVSQKISDDIQHLLVWMGGPSVPALKVDAEGNAKIPSDYAAFSSCYYMYQRDNCGKNELPTPRPIQFVGDGVFADRMACAINKPTPKHPIAKWGGNNMHFQPIGINMVSFSYIRMPAEPNLVVSIDTNNDYVYNASQSTQFEFPQTCIPDIANMIFMIMSGSMQSPLHIQLSQQQQQKGI